ncbi:GCN5-related N-acetyltransferase [Salinibacter altiplanensis]|uniref:GCN5-related N-acetyltransferase n=1 Tax=Salinibacter altiplanensis TaxID=1803181 RepID=UPI001319BC66|nr:GCN5-related N-acetyltransferase [Salinibacter altiplanensis]
MPQQIHLFTASDPDSPATSPECVRTMERLAEEVLPAKAASGNYPVRFDHCFKRIAYDMAVGAKWDAEVARPFYEHASREQVRRAVDVLRKMARDPARAAEYNRRSLRYRTAGA